MPIGRRHDAASQLFQRVENGRSFFLIWIVNYYLDYYLDIYLFLDFLTLDDQEMITSQSSIAMKEQSKKHRSAADRWRLIPTVC